MYTFMRICAYIYNVGQCNIFSRFFGFFSDVSCCYRVILFKNNGITTTVSTFTIKKSSRFVSYHFVKLSYLILLVSFYCFGPVADSSILSFNFNGVSYNVYAVSTQVSPMLFFNQCYFLLAFSRFGECYR